MCAAWAGSGETRDAAIWFDLADSHGPTEFLGYDTESAEGQVGAIVVDETDGRLLGAGVNLVLPSRNCTAHAEMVALSLAQQAAGGWNLGDGATARLATTAVSTPTDSAPAAAPARAAATAVVGSSLKSSTFSTSMA